MANCGNCKKKLNCACKIRKAANGKSCCTACIGSYQKTLPTGTTNNTVTQPSTIISATAK